MAYEILLVEDNLELARSIVEYFTSIGFKVDHLVNGKVAYRNIVSSNYDALILDVVIPGLNGIELCKKLRQDGVDNPVLILTQEADINSIVHGFDSGADAYMAKPFSLKELEARVKGLIQRRPSFSNKHLSVGDIQINLEKNEVIKQGEVIKLRKKEFQILKLLLEAKGRTLSREDIMLRTSKYFGEEVYASTVDVHISRIRKILGSFGDKDYIETVHGFGYRLGIVS